MRGYKQPAHCACDVPHGWDHSSPAHCQSYDAPQTPLFSASVGIRLSTRGKGVLPNLTRGGARFRRRGNRRAAAVAWKKLAISGCYRNGSADSRDVSARRTSRSAAASLGVASKTRDLACCDGAAAEAHLCHHRLKPARWTLRAAIAPVSYNSAIQVPLLFL